MYIEYNTVPWQHTSIVRKQRTEAINCQFLANENEVKAKIDIL